MSSVIDPSQIGNKPACPYCHKQLAHISSVYRHMRDGSCRVQHPNSSKKELIKSKQDSDVALQTLKETLENVQTMQKNMQGVMQETVKETMKEMFKTMGAEGSLIPLLTPIVNNHNHNHNHQLNVMCLSNNDNLLDMLALDGGGIHNALTYMKNCALAQLSGDCRILQRVYKLETQQPAIQKLNEKGTKFVYYDERRRRTTESNSELGKKLANILQRSYLKAMGSFRKDILGNKRDDPQLDQMPDLDEYEYTMMNDHVQQLNDEKYQKKLMRSLKIPQEPKRE